MGHGEHVLEHVVMVMEHKLVVNHVTTMVAVPINNQRANHVQQVLVK